MNTKNKIKKYSELFPWLVGESNKEFIARVERSMLMDLVEILSKIKYEDFTWTVENILKKNTIRYIIEVKRK